MSRRRFKRRQRGHRRWWHRAWRPVGIAARLWTDSTRPSTACWRCCSSLAREWNFRWWRRAGSPTGERTMQYMAGAARLRAHGRQVGDGEVVNLWAGQTHELAGEMPAGEVVRTLWEEARESLGRVWRQVEER